MNTSDPNTLPLRRVDWQHFDGSSGIAKISERQYLEGTHTVGASNHAKITIEFTGLIVPGMTATPGDPSISYFGGVSEQFNWMRVTSGTWPTRITLFSYAPFWLAADPASPTANFYVEQICSNEAVPTMGGPCSGFDFLGVSDVSSEVFVLTVDLILAPTLTVNFDLRSGGVVIIDNYTAGFDVNSPEAFPGDLTYRFGSVMQGDGELGITNCTVTKFYCEDLP